MGVHIKAIESLIEKNLMGVVHNIRVDERENNSKFGTSIYLEVYNKVERRYIQLTIFVKFKQSIIGMKVVSSNKTDSINNIIRMYSNESLSQIISYYNIDIKSGKEIIDGKIPSCPKDIIRGAEWIKEVTGGHDIYRIKELLVNILSSKAKREISTLDEYGINAIYELYFEEIDKKSSYLILSILYRDNDENIKVATGIINSVDDFRISEIDFAEKQTLEFNSRHAQFIMDLGNLEKSNSIKSKIHNIMTSESVFNMFGYDKKIDITKLKAMRASLENEINIIDRGISKAAKLVKIDLIQNNSINVLTYEFNLKDNVGHIDFNYFLRNRDNIKGVDEGVKSRLGEIIDSILKISKILSKLSFSEIASAYGTLGMILPKENDILYLSTFLKISSCIPFGKYTSSYFIAKDYVRSNRSYNGSRLSVSLIRKNDRNIEDGFNFMVVNKGMVDEFGDYEVEYVALKDIQDIETIKKLTSADNIKDIRGGTSATGFISDSVWNLMELRFALEIINEYNNNTEVVSSTFQDFQKLYISYLLT